MRSLFVGLVVSLVSLSATAGSVTVIPTTSTGLYVGASNLSIMATDAQGSLIAQCRGCKRLKFRANGASDKKGRITITGGKFGGRNFAMSMSGILNVRIK